jgi:hypothetical protein
MRGLEAKHKLHDARVAGRADGTPEEIILKDDYGREVEVLIEEIAGWLGGDLAKSFEGQVEATIIQTRAQADAQSRAQNDPRLKLQMAHPGGRILT